MNTQLIAKIRNLAADYYDHRYTPVLAVADCYRLKALLKSGKLGLDTENCEVE